MTATMKAARRDRYGTPDVVRIEEVEKPVPGEGEVLVRTRGASVNRADLDGIKPRPGFVRFFLGIRAPRDHRMGWDVAGVVESLGPGATRFKPGDEVSPTSAATARVPSPSTWPRRRRPSSRSRRA